MEKALIDLRVADRIIKRRNRYFCGIVNESEKDSIGCGDLFFESPDGQNGELYMELRKLGWRNAGYSAEYYWKVIKDGYFIEYVEGDIYIKLVEKLVANKA